MAATTETIQQTRPRAISLRWIINAREDLVWFVGSVASSYALLILYVTGVLPLIPMVAGWAILIDAPHVFGTFSRTYFDRSEWKTRKRLMLGSLLFFVIGPVMVLAGAGFTFFFIAALWAYYHLVKQHYGFMVLYKKKNHDLAPIDNALDRLLLLFAFNYPFVAFIAGDPTAMARVPPLLRSGVNSIALLLLIATIVLAIGWVARQVQRAITREPLNVPKYLLLAAAIPMHWIALLTPMPAKPIALVAILTIYHNLQYHRLIWFHNQKYSGTGVPPVAHAQDARATYGPAAGFRVIALDLPGYGYSDKPADGRYTIDSQAYAVVSLMNRLEIDEATIIGASYGGAVAATIALDYPERVSRLVLVGAVSNNDAMSKLLPRIAQLPLVGDVVTPLFLGSRYVLRKRMEDTYRRSGKPLDEHKLAARHHLLAAADSHRAMLRTIRRWSADRITREADHIHRPTLIIWGENDRHIPLSDGIRLREAIAGARLVVFRNCGHLPPAEQPEKFVEVITQFCDETLEQKPAPAKFKRKRKPEPPGVEAD